MFNKNSETTNKANLAIKKLKKFFDMTKSTTNNPVLKRNGVKNSCIISYSETYKIRLTAMPLEGRGNYKGYKLWGRPSLSVISNYYLFFK